MSKEKLEAIIDALTDSLDVIVHNPIETEYVLVLRKKYEEHYKETVGRYYRFEQKESKNGRI